MQQRALSDVISNLNASATEGHAQTVFGKTLDALPKGHARRGDLISKLRIRGCRERRLTDDAAEFLAYAVATRAADYQYELITLGEMGSTAGLILEVAARFSETLRVQRILEGSISPVLG